MSRNQVRIPIAVDLLEKSKAPQTSLPQFSAILIKIIDLFYSDFDSFGLKLRFLIHQPCYQTFLESSDRTVARSHGSLCAAPLSFRTGSGCTQAVRGGAGWGGGGLGHFCLIRFMDSAPVCTFTALTSQIPDTKTSALIPYKSLFMWFCAYYAHTETFIIPPAFFQSYQIANATHREL